MLCWTLPQTYRIRIFRSAAQESVVVKLPQVIMVCSWVWELLN